MASHLVPSADALHALLHDAAEAYVGDMVSPLKDLLPGFKVIEARIWIAIAARFGIAQEMPASIKVADLVLMATERRDLLPPGPPWPLLEGIQPLPNRIVPWPPAFARLAFKRRFKQLVRSCGEIAQLRQAAEAAEA
ncbi:phosphohydrolase [Pseudomonas sp. CBMAI 2609]|uniref:Phosphohydrolase n=1 Tax=Pseudomonas flavocrustae TaxID=2991719 RepID=A0ABT6IIL2_9PSED|nr:phosphohydrolase [Pseudomonas sp. CBMAI 2609]MDH4764320.1 phosphohydrolase [Pseudomonas sp. CBMAI 2609]